MEAASSSCGCGMRRGRMLGSCGRELAGGQGILNKKMGPRETYALTGASASCKHRSAMHWRAFDEKTQKKTWGCGQGDATMVGWRARCGMLFFPYRCHLNACCALGCGGGRGIIVSRTMNVFVVKKCRRSCWQNATGARRVYGSWVQQYWLHLC